MYYYDSFIFFGIMTLVVVLIIIFGKKIKTDPKSLVFLVLSVLISTMVSCQGNYARNLALYDRIAATDRIVYEQEGSKVQKDFELERVGTLSYRYVKEAPIFVADKDIKRSVQVELVRSGKNDSDTIRFCELTSSKGYPDDAIYYYQGRPYCFVSDRFLYRNAIFRFDEQFANQLIKRLLQQHDTFQSFFTVI